MPHTMERSHQFLEEYRAYLNLLARTRLPRWLQRWLDASDVVQQTLMNAQKHHEKLEDKDPAQVAAYLRQALQNQVCEEARKHWREKPNILLDDLVSSSAQMGVLLAADQSSPSAKLVGEELLMELANALAKLPDNQRTAIECRYLRVPRCSLAEIGRELSCTEKAAAGLLCRGLQKLRELLRKSQ
ncbi:MAG TPA: sigma-70 family RNA polymerase sigma factor [Gemmataceae bacterium]|nr:sigma-70 family RNA polymerase sigma factor [Gemmataceae bacterium]